MTPFFCTLVYPLEKLDPRVLRDSGWAQRSLADSVSQNDSAPRRTRYAADTAAARILNEAVRFHRGVENMAGDLNAVEAEIVPVQPRWSKLEGFLVLHVGACEGSSEGIALTELAQLARPTSELSQRVLALFGGGTEVAKPPFCLADVRRVSTMSLTAAPDDDPGQLHWEGSSALDRRIASLLVLREDRVEVAQPYEVATERPTPSYLIRSSATATVIVRLREVESVHVDKLRTVWTDVLLMELVQREALAAWSKKVREGAEENAKLDWGALENAFRVWRTSEPWGVEADHPLELALGRSVRAEIGTDELVARIGSEIEEHSAGARLRADGSMTRAVLFLAIAAALVPLLLQLSDAGLAESADVYFALALTASASVVVGALQSLRHR